MTTIHLKSFSDLHDNIPGLVIGTKICIEARKQGSADTQTATSFCSTDGFASESAVFYNVIVNYEHDSSKYIGKVVHAKIYKVLSKKSPKFTTPMTTLFAHFVSEYTGPAFKRHVINSEQYCQQNSADIIEAGARLELTVSDLGKFSQQVVATVSGMQFVVLVDRSIDVDETWCNSVVQASVTSSTPSNFGTVVRCVFVKFIHDMRNETAGKFGEPAQFQQALSDFPALVPNAPHLSVAVPAALPFPVAAEVVSPALIPGPPPLYHHALSPIPESQSGTTSESSSQKSPVPYNALPPMPALLPAMPALVPASVLTYRTTPVPSQSLAEIMASMRKVSVADDLPVKPAGKKRPTYSYPIGSFSQLHFNDDQENRYEYGTNVYRATWRSTLNGSERPVAVKLFDHNDLSTATKVRSLQEMMRSEVLALENLASVHVVKYVACMSIRYPDDDTWGKDFEAIVMEREDDLLEEYLKKFYTLSDEAYLAKIKPLMRQLLQAYIDIHSAKIIHRDVKPENTLVSVGPSGEAVVKVCDFGFCKSKDLQGKSKGHLSVVRANTFLGTVHRGCWIAPEVLLCANNHRYGAPQQSYTVEADIWPLGLVLFFMGSRGHSPIQYEEETRTAHKSPADRAKFLQSTILSSTGADTGWSLHAAYPMLYDLIELMVRPFSGTGSDQDRVSLETAVQHPFFWGSTITARLLCEFVDEINSRADVRRDFIAEINRECASVLPDAGWDIHHKIFTNLDRKDTYNTLQATFLLKAVRDVMAHERSHTHARDRAFVSNHHYKQVVVEGFVADYEMVLCALFRVTLATKLVNGVYVRKYGRWSGATQQDFQFSFFK